MLAIELNIGQQSVSALEQKEKIDDKVLEDVAKILKITPDAIRGFNEEAAVNYINNFHEIAKGTLITTALSIPLEKYIEALEENKKLYKIAILDKMLDKK